MTQTFVTPTPSLPPESFNQPLPELTPLMRRRLQRMPRWYQPHREDPATLPPISDLDRRLREYDEVQRRASLPGVSAAVVRPLPRRSLITPEHGMSSLLMQPDEQFHAGLFRTLSRFVIWTLSIIWFQCGVLWDKIRRRDSEQRRAERLLRTIQRIGGTMIKIGQQLAMRVDLLPYAYCVELSKLLDSMPSFPYKDAIAAIERATGKRLREVFARFDPEPIGSASVACVYQAVLRTGEKVAVKVRRPGIGTIFAADLRAISWIIGLVEFLAIVRPGNLRNLIGELESSFMEELDLRRESYFQETFRRNAQNPNVTRRFFFSAPRVFFEYSSSDVIVMDFVSGIWLWEILAGVETGDPAALARMRELKIDPKVVAERLLWISMWGNLSNVLFHADPHPANVIVQEDNHIILIDFGACGTVPTEKRHRFHEFFRCQGIKDISGMVKATLALLEPLPAIDLNAFEKDLERVFFRASAALWSKQARWWDRTTATFWLRLMQLTRKYNLPVNSDTVKGLRATMLYDTLALRLDNDLDMIKASQRFMRDTLHLSGRRMRRRVRARFSRGLRLRDYAYLEELTRLGGSAMEQLQRFVDHPPFNFNYSIEKPVYAVITVMKTGSFLGVVLLAAAGAIAAFRGLTGQPVSGIDIALRVVSSNAFQTLICLSILNALRRIMFRLSDRDV